MRMFVNIMRLLSLLGVFATLIVKSPPSSCVANASSNIFCKPTNGIVKQSFHNTHKAMDISGASGMVKGPEVYAPYDGRVVYVGRAEPANDSSNPNNIKHAVAINHGLVNGKYVLSFLVHMGSKTQTYIPNNISVGYPVQRGQLIGFQGVAGRASGTHLHWEIYEYSQPFRDSYTSWGIACNRSDLWWEFGGSSPGSSCHNSSPAIAVNPEIYAGSMPFGSQLTVDCGTPPISPPEGFVDGPTPNQIVNNTVQVRGWTKVNGSNIQQVEVYIDGTPRGTATYNQPRPDVGGNFGYFWDWNITQVGNGNHTIQVKAIAANGTSTFLKSASGGGPTTITVNVQNNLPPNTPNLLAPTNNSPSNDRNVTLSWQDTGDPDNQPRNYRDYGAELWKQDDSWRSNFDWNTATSWNIAVPSDGRYSWRVRAGDGEAGSDWSSTWSFLVDSTPPNVEIQPLPATQTTNQFAVNWSGEDALTSIASYEAQYREDSGAWQTLAIDVNQTSAIFTNGVHGHTYQFRVRAYDSVGNRSSWVESNSTSLQLNVPDSYENDNDAGVSSILIPPQTHNFHAVGDHDWVRFYVTANTSVTLLTTNLDTNADTYLELYDNVFNLIAVNDDWGGSHASRINVVRPTSGLLYARVRQYDPNVYGNNTGYTLMFATGDTWEHNNDAASATIIGDLYNRGVTEHTTHVPSDRDWVTFSNASANIPMTLMTLDLGPSSDTVLEVHTNAGVLTNDDDNWGNGYASRIDFMSDAGAMLANVRQYAPAMYGEDTRYKLLLAEGDAYEFDDFDYAGEPLPTDGSPRAHTTHVPRDVDHHLLSLTAGSRYAIYVELEGSNADVTLKLWEWMQSSSEPLAENTEFNPVLSVVAPDTGQYVLQISPYDRTVYGPNSVTGYQVIALEDAEVPVGTITSLISVTTSLTIPVGLSASDVGSGVYQMEFASYSNAADTWLWTGWLPFQSSYNYALSNEDGPRTIFVHYRDRAGNVSEWATVTVLLDRQAPTVDFTVTPPDTQWNGIFVDWTANDTTAGIATLQLKSREMGGLWQVYSFADPNTTSALFYGVPGGSYQFALYASDHAGNSFETLQYDANTPACVGDSEEPDNTSTTSSVQTVTSTVQHTICQQGDQDWIQFEAIASHRYVFETADLVFADTVLTLYGTDATTVLAINDDTVTENEYSLESRISWYAPNTGLYYLKVNDYQAAIAGDDVSYTLTITDTGAGSQVFLPMVVSPESSTLLAQRESMQQVGSSKPTPTILQPIQTLSVITNQEDFAILFQQPLYTPPNREHYNGNVQRLIAMPTIRGTPLKKGLFKEPKPMPTKR